MKMDDRVINKIYFGHRKIIKYWEQQMAEKPVVFEDGKKVSTPEPEVVPQSEEISVAADAPAEIDTSNVDDIIKNFVKRPQGSVDDIIGSL